MLLNLAGHIFVIVVKESYVFAAGSVYTDISRKRAAEIFFVSNINNSVVVKLFYIILYFVTVREIIRTVVYNNDFDIIVGLIYLVEVLSVMIQVTYFKKTGGKRFFKMAPIHHHFELCGWSETRVVAVFSIVTAILCLVALLAL